MREDLEEYQEAVKEYHRTLNRFKRFKEVRTHAHFSEGDCFIRVYEVENDELGKRLVSVSDEEDTVVYQLATRELKRLIEREVTKNEEKKMESSDSGSGRISNMYVRFDVPEYIRAER